MNFQNRKPLLAMLLTVLTVFASACGGPANETAVPTPTTAVGAPTSEVSNPPTEMPTESAANKPSGKIDLQAFGDPPEMKVIAELVAGFKGEYPGAEVNVINVPSQSEHMAKLSTAFAAGNPPDVWLLNYRRYGQFAASGVIEPVEERMAKSAVINKSMYYEVALNAFTYNGTLQCVPQNISSLVVYYNKDMFAKNGVPFPKEGWTWQDFLDAATANTKDNDGDGKMDTYGLGVAPQFIRVAPFVWQNGGDIVDNPDKPTRLALMEGSAREAVQFFMDLQLVHKVVPSEAEEKAEDGEARFMNGRLAMFMASRVATPAFREIKGFEWDVAPLPMGKKKASILHSDAFCISKDAKNKELAWAFVEYSQSPKGQKIAAELGRTVPSLKEVAESDVFLKPTLPPASAKVFLDAIPQMGLVPKLSTWPKIESMVNEELERAFYNIVPIDVALKKAEDDTAKLFADANK